MWHIFDRFYLFLKLIYLPIVLPLRIIIFNNNVSFDRIFCLSIYVICFNEISCFYITIQHRRERVLSLTTSLVTPLNFVIVGAESPCIKSFVDDNNDISIDWPIPLFGPLHKLLFDVILCGAPINEPFSDAVALLRDCARCFFKLANVVPACDWSILWVSVIFHTIFCFFFLHFIH